ncbi:WD40 repeat-like protein [Calocera cornea HHB12733]|uniref:WD40 repeat-like protein n=1 Tax=Calocera cornea HHB12733 TaxID=1353952 RepID=A0A165D1I5_9BASI|nr:WD40 repeat-like protein [Calocera cornea HHB12733]
MPNPEFVRRIRTATANGGSGDPSPNPQSSSTTGSTNPFASLLDAGPSSSSGSSIGSYGSPNRTFVAPGTPTTSPRKRKARDYGDRFIPNRDDNLQTAFQLIGDSPSTPSRKRASNPPATDGNREQANLAFQSLLATELFPGAPSSPPRGSATPAGTPSTPARKRIFQYSSPSRSRLDHDLGLSNPVHQAYSISPVKFESQRLLLSPQKTVRKVSKTPFKVLDAPDLIDDYYLNLVDWSSTSILGVGLGTAVYVWTQETGAERLFELASGDSATSVNWCQRGSILAVGTQMGKIQIWDAEAQKQIRTLSGHDNRIGCLAWTGHLLSSGSKDRTIYHRDTRARNDIVKRLTTHRQEICGLKWSDDTGGLAGCQLASGGNDNKLFVWDGKMMDNPVWKFHEHTAAVKAIDWNPHSRGVLASGGGTQDKKIRFWNTVAGTMLGETDTGSQVCNLVWSKNTPELVSTHGYSTAPGQNQIIIWRYPSMSTVTQLTGHNQRVLYLAMSPDGTTIVTGAGDETLRFWNVFPKREETDEEKAIGEEIGPSLELFNKVR